MLCWKNREEATDTRRTKTNLYWSDFECEFQWQMDARGPYTLEFVAIIFGLCLFVRCVMLIAFPANICVSIRGWYQKLVNLLYGWRY